MPIEAALPRCKNTVYSSGFRVEATGFETVVTVGETGGKGTRAGDGKLAGAGKLGAAGAAGAAGTAVGAVGAVRAARQGTVRCSAVWSFAVRGGTCCSARCGAVVRGAVCHGAVQYVARITFRIAPGHMFFV